MLEQVIINSIYNISAVPCHYSHSHDIFTSHPVLCTKRHFHWKQAMLPNLESHMKNCMINASSSMFTIQIDDNKQQRTEHKWNLLFIYSWDSIQHPLFCYFVLFFKLDFLFHNIIPLVRYGNKFLHDGYMNV